MSSKKIETYRTFSSDETKGLGFNIARSLADDFTPKNSATGNAVVKKNGAVVLALQGDLGAGKTTFTQGFLKGLGYKGRVASPTFILMRKYKLPAAGARRDASHKNFTNVFHIDAYRLKNPEHVAILGFDGILSESRNVVLIEWPEQAKKILPKNALWLKFAYGKKENERTITITWPAAQAQNNMRAARHK